MIYRAIQLIQIFLADGLTKVIQEVLADLKRESKSGDHHDGDGDDDDGDLNSGL